MFLGDLALEIQYNILEHFLPSDLAVLSRVHTSVRDVMECALYSHVRYCAQPLDMVSSGDNQATSTPQRLNENRSLLHTFTTNSRKASMVKTLYIELEKNWGCDEAVCFVLVKLAEVLEKMPKLVDLRIIHSPTKDLSQGRISQVIRFVCDRWQSPLNHPYNLAPYRGGYFKLHTLYLEYSHDLEGIIADQPQLQLLGIYFYLDILDIDLWAKIEQLYQSPSRRRTMPVVFLRDSSRHGALIYMLPSFYRPGEALQVCRETTASLQKWHNGFHGYEQSLSLIGISKENISLLGEVIGAMSACRDYYTRQMTIVLHDKYIQVSYQACQYILMFIIFDRSHGVFLNFLDP